MFDIGLQEMLVICVLALLVFGPSKLPELGRMFGRAMREFRRASDEFRSTVETNLNINGDGERPAPPSAPLATDGGGAVAALPSETEATAVADGSAVALATETAPAPPEAFCAQRQSRIFHRSECAWAARIPAYERRYLKSVAEAREEGLLTCPVCEPWEPA